MLVALGSNRKRDQIGKSGSYREIVHSSKNWTDLF